MTRAKGVMAWVLGGLLLGSVTASADSGSQSLSPSGGAVRFLAKGRPSAVRISGTGGAPTGVARVNGSQVTGEFELALDSLDTGIGLRTAHLKEKYLETGKYPRAEFRITEMNLPAPLQREDYLADDVPIAGMLALHGVRHPVSGKATVRSAQGQVTAKVRFPVLLSAHSIVIPRYFGISVADEVEVEVEFGARLPSDIP